MTAAVNAAGRTTAASLPCCLTNRRIECVKEAVVYVGFAARVSVSRVAATGRERAASRVDRSGSAGTDDHCLDDCDLAVTATKRHRLWVT